MAEIHLIPSSVRQDKAQLHLQALTRAIAEGRDLGHRGPHIRALGQSLAILLEELRDQQRTLLSSPQPLRSEVQQVLHQLPELIELIERAILFASTFDQP